MYDYLKDMGMFPLMRGKVGGRKKKYYVSFVIDKDSDYTDCLIVTDWGYIRHVDAINLCANEIVIEAKYSDMKININYKDIDKFEVKLYEDYE